MRANSYSALWAKGGGTCSVGAPVTGMRARAPVTAGRERDAGGGLAATAPGLASAAGLRGRGDGGLTPGLLAYSFGGVRRLRRGSAAAPATPRAGRSLCQ